LLRPQRIGGSDQGDAVVARIRPNEDVCTAVETIARQHGMRDAIVRGSLGSLIGARFTDGREVADDATEVLVRSGAVHDGVATIEMVVVDMRGKVHEGCLTRADNPVCITFDLVLEPISPPIR
jgi:predicted DNA-binding protein with PD1-like motif